MEALLGFARTLRECNYLIFFWGDFVLEGNIMLTLKAVENLRCGGRDALFQVYSFEKKISSQFSCELNDFGVKFQSTNIKSTYTVCLNKDKFNIQ